MGLLYYLDNKLRVHNTLRSPKRSLEPVVTLTSSVFNTMPNAGKKLLANGYKLQSTSCDVYGRYTWVFVLKDGNSTNNKQTERNYMLASRKESDHDLQDEIFGDFRPDDPMVRKALEIAFDKGVFSLPMIQVYLGRSRNYIQRLANWLENLGIIEPANGNESRRKLMISSLDEFDEMINEAVSELLSGK